MGSIRAEAAQRDYASLQPQGRDLLRFLHNRLAPGAATAIQAAVAYKLDLGETSDQADDGQPLLPPGAAVTRGTQTDYRCGTGPREGENMRRRGRN